MGWFFLAAIVFDVLTYTFSIASNSLAEAKKFGPAIVHRFQSGPISGGGSGSRCETTPSPNPTTAPVAPATTSRRDIGTVLG